MADSISLHGKLVAMLMVSGEDHNRLVLIDGYRCHAVLTYLGQDAGLFKGSG